MRNPFLTISADAPARMRLFCLPHAGGGGAIFYSWSGGISDTVQICPVHLPGRESRFRELPYVRLDALVRDLATSLVPFCKIPFGFFGHSVGAYIAFETARKLRREHNAVPSCVIVSACRAPQLPSESQPFHHLPDVLFLRELQRRYGDIPDAVLGDPQLMELFLPVLKADMAVMETYAYCHEEPLECPIIAYGGVDDHTVPRNELELWREQTSSEFKMRLFPGGHLFLSGARDLILQGLSQDLAKLAISHQTFEAL